MAARMSKAQMEQRDYELEIIRMEFMDKILEIAREAWESQRETWRQVSADSPGNLDTMENTALHEQSWWVEKQLEFISKLIDNFKNNSAFRQIVSINQPSMDEIDHGLQNEEFIGEFLNNPDLKKNRLIEGHGDIRFGSKVGFLSDLLNRCFRKKSNSYQPGEESLSSLSAIITQGLLFEMIFSFLSGSMKDYERSSLEISGQGRESVFRNIRHLNLFPLVATGVNNIYYAPTLTYFQKYFSCYYRCLTELLQVNVYDRIDNKENSSHKGGKSKGGGRDNKDDTLQKIGGKKTHKKRKTKK